MVPLPHRVRIHPSYSSKLEIIFNVLKQEDVPQDENGMMGMMAGAGVLKGTRCLRVKSLVDSEKVFAVLNYYEVDGEFSMESLQMTYVIYLVSLPCSKSNELINTSYNLLNSLPPPQGLNQIAFDELRTKEQLGYVVYATIHQNPDYKFGIVLFVGRQTDKHW